MIRQDILERHPRKILHRPQSVSSAVKNDRRFGLAARIAGNTKVEGTIQRGRDLWFVFQGNLKTSGLLTGAPGGCGRQVDGRQWEQDGGTKMKQGISNHFTGANEGNGGRQAKAEN